MQVTTLVVLAVSFLALYGGAAALRELVRRRKELACQPWYSTAQVESFVEQAGEYAFLQERHRVASGLHDGMGNAVTALVLHSEHLLRLPGLPAEARPSLLAMQQGARRALTDLREHTRMLQDGREEPEPGAVSRISSTELLAAMACNMQAIGIAMTFETSGVPRQLPVRVERAIYRMAMEGLSTGAMHAPGKPVATRLRFGTDVMDFEVEHRRLRPLRLPGAPVANHLNGLNGLRDTVTEAGGSFMAGPAGNDGFVLLARFGVDQEHPRRLQGIDRAPEDLVPCLTTSDGMRRH